MREGLPFDQFIEKVQESGSVRVIVVDENSGSMGSVTVPVAALTAKNCNNGYLFSGASGFSAVGFPLAFAS